jgi:hypothetical protein
MKVHFMDVALYKGVYWAFCYEGMSMLLMDHKGVFGTNFGMSILWSLYPRKLVDPLLMPGCCLGRY